MTVRHLHVVTEAAPRSRLLYVPLFVGDYLAEVQGWPFDARGAYLSLLIAQWTMVTLPAEPNELRKIIGASRMQWKAAWRYVEGKFPPHGKGRQNPDLEQRRRYVLKRIEQCRAGAAKTNARLGRGGQEADHGDR